VRSRQSRLAEAGRFTWVFGAICVLILRLCGNAAADDGSERLPIVVFGDSQAQGIAGGLSRLLVEDPRYRILNRTHPGAALVHGEHEWLAPIEKFIAHEKADVAIVMFGANDRLDLPAADGGYLRFRTDAWHEAYTARTDKILKALTDAKLRIIWCGNPIARSQVYSNDMVYINEIFAQQVVKFGGQFFPLWDIITDGQGHYAAHAKDLSGVTRRMRADDGIHFTAAGYELIADKLLGLLPAADTHAAKAP